MTWDVNYERTDRELALGGKLFANYDLLLTDYEMAAKAAVRGMVEGWYTGTDLDDYMDGVDESDAEDCRQFVNARRIINGTN